MSINKKYIVKKAVEDSSISHEEAFLLFQSLLNSIKEYSKSNVVKLSGFGTFSFKKTPQRNGRNPKTQDSYIIPALNKLNFKPSNKIKEKINL